MGRSDEIAAITPSDVTEFISRLVAEYGGGRYARIICIYHTAEARKLVLAKRELDAMVAWHPDAKRAGELQNCADMIGSVVKAAVVDEAVGTVGYHFTSRDIELLRPVVFALVEYEIVKKADGARPRSNYRGKK